MQIVCQAPVSPSVCDFSPLGLRLTQTNTWCDTTVETLHPVRPVYVAQGVHDRLLRLSCRIRVLDSRLHLSGRFSQIVSRRGKFTSTRTTSMG